MDNGESSYRRFLLGDEAALDEILERYRLHLIFFIDRIVHDPDTAPIRTPPVPLRKSTRSRWTDPLSTSSSTPKRISPSLWALS